MLLQQKPEVAENFLKAMIESFAFTFAPKNKPAVVKTIMTRLKTEQSSAEEGYEGLSRALAYKPFPSVEGLHNAQRLMKICDPKLGELKVETIIDGRIMRRLEETGFIDATYAAQGLK